MSQTINRKRGFLRLWAVVSILWLGTVSTFVVTDSSWQGWRPPEDSSATTTPYAADNLCVYCDAQGVVHVTQCTPDAQDLVPFTLWPVDQPQTAEQVTSTETAEKRVHTVDELIALAKTRGKNSVWISRSTCGEKRVQVIGEMFAQMIKENLWKQRRDLIIQALPLAFGLPLALLFLGGAVSWIIRGFTAR